MLVSLGFLSLEHRMNKKDLVNSSSVFDLFPCKTFQTVTLVPYLPVKKLLTIVAVVPELPTELVCPTSEALCDLG